MYYGIADKFLLDNALRMAKNNILVNCTLISYQAESMAEVMKNVAMNYKRDLVYAVKLYNTSMGANMSQSAFLSNYLGSRYIVTYERVGDKCFKIIEKKDLKNENMDKYTILC